MKQELILKAEQAKASAYAPYSGIKVGAAILSKDRSVFQGANVENASYSLSLCAERLALYKAVFAGQREFKAIAVTSDQPIFIYPCGACLQALSEFGDLIIIVAKNIEEYQEYKLSECLTRVFKYPPK